MEKQNVVTLTAEQMSVAVGVAVLRHLESFAQGLKNAHGLDGDWRKTLLADIDGSAAEKAYCLFRGIRWTGGVNTFHGADAGRATQVRHTRNPRGSLIVREADNQDHFYVLMVGVPPVFRVAGFIRGRDARRPEWLKSPNDREPAWFVPQDQLKPFKTA